ARCALLSSYASVITHDPHAGLPRGGGLPGGEVGGAAAGDLPGRVPPSRGPAGPAATRANRSPLEATCRGGGVGRCRRESHGGPGRLRAASPVTAGPVFLDSGIFIAFLDRSDRHHPVAVQLFAEPPRRWYTSLAVVSETYGWFLHRLGEEAARIFRLALAELPRLQLLPVTPDHHVAVLANLERLRGHKL